MRRLVKIVIAVMAVPFIILGIIFSFIYESVRVGEEFAEDFFKRLR
jgi:hypothetical protein